MLFHGKISGQAIEFEPKDEEEWILFTSANQDRKMWIEVGFETKQRTIKQNSGLHKGLQLLADALNLSGLDMRKVLSQEINIPWNDKTCKEYLYRPLMTAMLLKKSTTELTKEQISEVWDVLMHELGEKHGLEYIDFPSKKTMNK